MSTRLHSSRLWDLGPYTLVSYPDYIALALRPIKMKCGISIHSSKLSSPALITSKKNSSIERKKYAIRKRDNGSDIIKPTQAQKNKQFPKMGAKNEAKKEKRIFEIRLAIFRRRDSFLEAALNRSEVSLP
ncbi:hypothetical protein CEXT_443691 [Caerostris extrusa]|uniref:Uncharacterized protein n=1 Tax=Caerostris extrusa TaxID=172846 RepID=A0AAV4X1B4_CAEEX|nr:hypothetical protein CEXT_443691 [Caerostris extrusa]